MLVAGLAIKYKINISLVNRSFLCMNYKHEKCSMYYTRYIVEKDIETNNDTGKKSD